MSPAVVTRPTEILNALSVGRPVNEPAAMPILNLDRDFLHDITHNLGDLSKAQTPPMQSAWFSGDRGCGKSQSKQVVGQMIASVAARQDARILQVELEAKDIRFQSVEEIVLSAYFRSTAPKNDQHTDTYRLLQARLEEQKAELEQSISAVFGLGIDLLSFLLPASLVSKSDALSLVKDITACLRQNGISPMLPEAVRPECFEESPERKQSAQI